MAKINESLPVIAHIFIVFLVRNVLSMSCPSAANGKTLLSGVSQYEIDLILNVHNKLRQSVALGQVYGQPPAQNMMEMKWDRGLATRAQWWALNCQSVAHDSQRHFGIYPVGQNIAATWTTKVPQNQDEIRPDFEYAILKWFQEQARFRFGLSPSSAGHYTQLIWAESETVGCGYSFNMDQGRFTKKYVCNYGPSGNVIGESPYTKGYPNCYAYGLDVSKKYTGLCDRTNNNNFITDRFFLERFK